MAEKIQASDTAFFFGKNTLKFIALVMTWLLVMLAVPHVSLWGLGGIAQKESNNELVASAIALLSLASMGTDVVEAQTTCNSNQIALCASGSNYRCSSNSQCNTGETVSSCSVTLDSCKISCDGAPIQFGGGTCTTPSTGGGTPSGPLSVTAQLPNTINPNSQFPITFNGLASIIGSNTFAFLITPTAPTVSGQIQGSQCVGGSCPSVSVTLPAGTYTISAELRPPGQSQGPAVTVTTNSGTNQIQVGQGVVGLPGTAYICNYDPTRRNCVLQCSPSNPQLDISYPSLQACQQAVGQTGTSSQAQTYNECNEIGGKWCIQRGQLGQIRAYCVDGTRNCNVGDQPGTGSENLCQEACQGRQYGFGGYGYTTPTLGGIPIGTCTAGSPLLFLGNVVGGNVAQQASVQPYPITGPYLCTNRQETCWCTVFSVGTAFTTGSSSGGLFGNSPTIPGTTSTPHWTDPNAIDDPPKANPNEFVCTTVSDVGLRAEVDSPGLSTEELKIFASGQQVTITGEVAKFSATCLGYKYQCERFQEFACDFKQGFFKDTWKYQKFPGSSSSGLCPGNLPEILEKRGAGSKWHIGRILTLVAMAVLVLATMGVFGPIFGATTPAAAGSTVTTTTSTTLATGSGIVTASSVPSIAVGSTITAASGVIPAGVTIEIATAGSIATGAAATASAAFYGSMAALTLAPMLDGCGPNAAGLALLTQAGLNSATGSTGSGGTGPIDALPDQCESRNGACITSQACSSDGYNNLGRLDCPSGSICCAADTASVATCTNACTSRGYTAGACEVSATLTNPVQIGQNGQFGCSTNTHCNCYGGTGTSGTGSLPTTCSACVGASKTWCLQGTSSQPSTPQCADSSGSCTGTFTQIPSGCGDAPPPTTGGVIGVAQAQSSGGILGSNPLQALGLMNALAGPGLACQGQEQRVCYSVCGKTYDTAVAAEPVCNQGGVVIGFTEANYACSEGSCGGYAGKTVNIEVLDIDGTTLFTDSVTTDANGEFSYTMTAPNTDGVITVVLTSDAPVTASSTP